MRPLNISIKIAQLDQFPSGVSGNVNLKMVLRVVYFSVPLIFHPAPGWVTTTLKASGVPATFSKGQMFHHKKLFY